jgi:polyisoprenoid-binding protein YceI
MLKSTALLAVLAMFALGGSSNNASSSGGSWRVDTGHSDAQLITDATTDYGRTKLNVTLGFGRVNGKVDINNDDLSKSSFDFRF